MLLFTFELLKVKGLVVSLVGVHVELRVKTVVVTGKCVVVGIVGRPICLFCCQPSDLFYLLYILVFDFFC